MINAFAKSKEQGAAHRAENILSIMERKYRQGDKSAKPNTRTYTTIIDAWAKSGLPDAARKAEEIFITMDNFYERMKDEECRPNVFTANAVMNACAFTRLENNKRGALETAFRVFHWLSSKNDMHPDAYSFTIMLSCISNLLPRHDRETRYLHARDLFLKCRQVGHVNDFVLKKLRQTVTEDEFLGLVEYQMNATAVSLPPSWTRNERLNRRSTRSSNNPSHGRRGRRN